MTINLKKKSLVTASMVTPMVNTARTQRPRCVYFEEIES